MNIAEAIAALEADCVVHDVAGFAVGDYVGPVDMNRAPNGEKYICLTSSGLKVPGQPVAVWFCYEEEAIAGWLAEARFLRRDYPGITHLYWRNKPSLAAASFVNVQQHTAIQDDRLRESLSVDLRYVSSWLLFSGKDPAGKDGVG